MISIDSCMIIHYTLEESVFVVIVYTPFITEEILKRHIKDCFIINGEQTIKICQIQRF